MKFLFILSGLMLAASFYGCATPRKDEEIITLVPFKDTFSWHSYSVSKQKPESLDGRFRLIAVSENGDVGLKDLSSGENLMIKRNLTMDEIVVSRMPMRVKRSDFKEQSAEFEWLTTN